MFYCKNAVDPNIQNPKYLSKIKEQLINNDKLRHKYNSISVSKRKLNTDGYEIIDNIKAHIYEIPVLEIDNLNKNIISWLLSYELNDIIRIMIYNKINFDENGNIIILK
jgi:hypothetical protein